MEEKNYSVDPELFTVESLLAALLNSDYAGWRTRAKIIKDYLPQHARAGTKPRCVVVFDYEDRRDGEADCCFLRHSNGPRQGHFWDEYGDDYLTPELALIALLRAPVPPPLLGQYFSHKFTMRLPENQP
jgi:hypothetical protein